MESVLSSSGLASSQFYLSLTPETFAEVVKFWEGNISPDKTITKCMPTSKSDTEIYTNREDLSVAGTNSFSGACACSCELGGGATSQKQTPSEVVEGWQVREFSITLTLTSDVDFNVLNFQTPPSTSRPSQFYSDEREPPSENRPVSIQMCSSLLLDKGSEENSTVCTQIVSPISHLKTQVAQLEEENECIQAPMQRLQEMMHQSGLPSDQRKVWQEISQVNEASSTFALVMD